MKGSTRRLVWPEPVSKAETASIGGERRVQEGSLIMENLVGYCQTSSLSFFTANIQGLNRVLRSNLDTYP